MNRNKWLGVALIGLLLTAAACAYVLICDKDDPDTVREVIFAAPGFG